MEHLLQTVIKHFMFLFEENRFHITQTEASSSHGGNALVIFTSNELRVRLARDREQVFIEVQAAQGMKDYEWYPVAALRQLLEGTTKRLPNLDIGADAVFLKENLGRLAIAFAAEEIRATKTALGRILNERSRSRF